MEKNTLFDEQREKEFHQMNVGDNSDADVCQFFFSALGMIVADLVTAKSSPLTDPRHTFASLLSKVQTIPNAPYFDESVVFDAEEPCLADVLLQMIRNYINGGPLVNKLSRDELQWAVSVCLSHATPLQIHTLQSIGIIPLVHLFPHGGTQTNSYVIARNAREKSAAKMAAFFRDTFGYDFSAQHSGRWIYVVCDRELRAGDEVCLQAMAPVCDRDSEAEQMWRLSCGTAPSEYMASSAVARRQLQLTQEIIDKGSDLLRPAQW
ncbi:hypothetical protein STCU_06003 [Strigomonas culicis]|nr:hypothetical protein STCU_06003 [Strigomonas culicis]|eukprot:EPY26938.1 hypothetical protein STCU_06003 [Strigomonas culicis]